MNFPFPSGGWSLVRGYGFWLVMSLLWYPGPLRQSRVKLPLRTSFWLGTYSFLSADETGSRCAGNNIIPCTSCYTFDSFSHFFVGSLLILISRFMVALPTIAFPDLKFISALICFCVVYLIVHSRFNPYFFFVFIQFSLSLVLVYFESMKYRKVFHYLCSTKNTEFKQFSVLI